MSRHLLMSMLIVFLMVARALGGGVPPAEDTPSGKALKAAAEASQMAQKAGVAVEVALTALENAMAAQDQVEEELMLALKAMNKAKIATAERKLKTALEDVAEATDLVKVIIASASECSAAAASAADEAKRMTPDLSSRESRSRLKRVDQLLDAAREALQRCDEAALRLKKKWLVPAIAPVTTTTTTTTTTVPSPTPVGRR